MRLLISFLFLSFFSCSLNAATQVTTFGYPVGIVSDTNEWTCSVTSSNSKSVLNSCFCHNPLPSNTSIIGVSKSLPVVFEFFYFNNAIFSFNTSNVKHTYEYRLNQISNRFQSVLSSYAMKTSSVVSDFSVSEINFNTYMCSCCFFDNKSSGYIRFYVQANYFMFVVLRSELFDEDTMDVVMGKPYELITPLFMPKQLSAKMGVDFEKISDCIFVE